MCWIRVWPRPFFFFGPRLSVKVWPLTIHSTGSFEKWTRVVSAWGCGEGGRDLAGQKQGTWRASNSVEEPAGTQEPPLLCQHSHIKKFSVLGETRGFLRTQHEGAGHFSSKTLRYSDSSTMEPWNFWNCSPSLGVWPLLWTLWQTLSTFCFFHIHSEKGQSLWRTPLYLGKRRKKRQSFCLSLPA